MLKKFLRDEAGLELSEYAIAAAIITLAVVGAITALSGAITSNIMELKNRLSP